jgi:organic hydroperoxide reductase OsmC/OhrA
MSDDVHTYAASCSWRGSTGVGYDDYNRNHTGRVPPTQITLDLSGDPAFRGDAGLLNPEQLLVLAASSCQLLSFLAVAARARVDVVAYDDDATGEMPEGRTPWVERIVLRPTVVYRGDVSEDRIRHLLEVAHRECYIANSVKTEITLEPRLERAV